MARKAVDRQGAVTGMKSGQPAAEADAGDGEIGKSFSKSLRKALTVLKALAGADHPLLMAQLADQAKIARPTTYRLVQTLINEGFVIRDPIDGRLSIGYEVLPLAASLLDGNRLRMVALPHLDSLAKSTGERVNLGILLGGEVMYLGGIEKPTLPTLYSRFGRSVPAYCSSLGKAMLAYMSEAEQDEHLAGVEFAARTPATITSMNAFRADLEKVRKQGYALDREESVRGTFCVGVPILNHEHQPICAISLSGRSSDTLMARLDELQQTAERIAHAL